MNQAMDIRPAHHEDADEASEVLRRSIAELCTADHKDDADEIAAWLDNKTPASWRSWTAQADTSLYVAIDHGRVAGVGMCNHRGEIMLNYVSPDHRFRGVSKAMLDRMESDLFAAGVTRCFLESTRTAHGFYLACGYLPVAGDGDTGGLLQKDLVW